MLQHVPECLIQPYCIKYAFSCLNLGNWSIVVKLMSCLFMETYSSLLTQFVKKKRCAKHSDTPVWAVNCVSFINFPISVSIIFVESGV